jgi:hypothetical protein
MSDSLFDYKPAPKVQRDHPETSHQAADKIEPITGQWRLDIYEFAAMAPAYGVTDDEIFKRWPDTPESTLRPRRTELCDAGWLIDSGKKRPNRRGNPCTVWIINPERVHQRSE